MGMSDLLLDTALDVSQRDYAHTIRDSATALLTVINDILDFSKIEADKLELEQIEVDFRRIANDVARLLTPQAQAKHVELDISVDFNVPRLLLGDPGRLRQILVNLCGNAIKFTSAGSVAISAKATECSPESVWLHVEVQDSGMGIPPERLPALFAPFAQVDASTTRRFGGTGLGLAIVRHLVELMQGEVGVRSTLGIGSTFWFHLPLAIATSAPAPAPPQASSSEDQRRPRRYRLLLAEDNLVNQKVARMTLEKLGYHVDIVADGEAALDAWASGDYDLILMDCQMPILDGYAATREIRRRESSGNRIPIIALTAHAIGGAEEESQASGMDAHLTKPVQREQLQRLLAQYLNAAEPARTERSRPLATESG